MISQVRMGFFLEPGTFGHKYEFEGFLNKALADAGFQCQVFSGVPVPERVHFIAPVGKDLIFKSLTEIRKENFVNELLSLFGLAEPVDKASDQTGSSAPEVGWESSKSLGRLKKWRGSLKGKRR